MIYDFLYKTKPLTAVTPIILFVTAVIGSTTCGILCYIHLKHVPKNKEMRKYVIYKYVLLSSLFNLAFLISSVIYGYNHITTPNENTKTTDLYRITKEKDFLTFTAKKPYNHLYKTKTMKITYTNSDEYVIITNNQTYKISKTSIKEK